MLKFIKVSISFLSFNVSGTVGTVISVISRRKTSIHLVQFIQNFISTFFEMLANFPNNLPHSNAFSTVAANSCWLNELFCKYLIMKVRYEVLKLVPKPDKNIQYLKRKKSEKVIQFNSIGK